MGSLLYYARAVNLKIRLALGSILGNNNKPTEHITKEITKILNYVAIYSLVVIKYEASPMILHINSDTS